MFGAKTVTMLQREWRKRYTTTRPSMLIESGSLSRATHNLSFERTAFGVRSLSR